MWETWTYLKLTVNEWRRGGASFHSDHERKLMRHSRVRAERYQLDLQHKQHVKAFGHRSHSYPLFRPVNTQEKSQTQHNIQPQNSDRLSQTAYCAQSPGRKELCKAYVAHRVMRLAATQSFTTCQSSGAVVNNCAWRSTSRETLRSSKLCVQLQNTSPKSYMSQLWLHQQTDKHWHFRFSIY